MRRLLRNARDDLAAFIEQERDLLLLVDCSDDDVPILLGLLREIEQQDDDALYLLFADELESVEAFVELTVERLRAEHCVTDAAMQQEGEPPLPPMPEGLLDDSRDPLQRLREAVGFARALIGDDPGPVVWAMLPQRIDDRQAHSRVLASLAPRGGQPPLGGLRLILRGDALTAAGLLDAPRTRLLRFDLGPAALAESLDQEAGDESLPMDQRMQALLQLAVLDYAHRRYEGAVEKYHLLLGHYQSTGDLAMQAFVINGLGEIHNREGDLEQAEHWFECAVPPASESGNAVVLYTVVNNLADVSFAKRQFARAEQLYDSADQLCGLRLDPEGKARALERRGLSQREQRAYDRAQESWRAAAELCRSVGMDELLRVNLGHLEQLHHELGQRRQLAEVQAELERIGEEEHG
jgi:tetratricopeptide (TPR) repeat protein